MSLLEGKTAVVTGAGGGIGIDVARLFAAEGAAVVALDLKWEDTATAALREASPAAEARSVDVTDPAALEAVYAEFPEADVLVTCAGIREVTPALEIELAEWQRVLDVNLTGTFVACQAAGRAMRAHGKGGAIVTVTSVAGMIGIAGRPAYSASKAGIIGLTRNLAVELAGVGVTVNSIAPGQIRTPLTEPYWQNDAFREGLAQTIPIGRGGYPDDVSKVALFLASDLGAYVTGTVIPIDGGWVAEKSFAPPGPASEAYLNSQSVD
jgi:NAD(P)-dependent dehydrogenase (short-subunit alcohol dehydrogenase family)